MQNKWRVFSSPLGEQMGKNATSYPNVPGIEAMHNVFLLYLMKTFAPACERS